jgi:hypothetical protein
MVTVTVLGVLFPGAVGVVLELPPPPPHRDAETAAANTVTRISDDRMLLFLQEETRGSPFVEQTRYQR